MRGWVGGWVRWWVRGRVAGTVGAEVVEVVAVAGDGRGDS